MTPLAESILRCRVEGNIVHLPDISEGALPNYKDVRQALLNAGAKYKRNTFVFESDAQPYIDRLTSGESVNIKKEFQFFATPDDVIDSMLDKINIQPYHKVLEPSAGDGAIIKKIVEKYSPGIDHDPIVDCFEIMDLNRKKLEGVKGAKLIGDDFLKCDLKDTYDIIVANPPFTKNQDIDHIRKMFEVCKPGGSIVTLASLSWTFGSEKKQVEFRNWIKHIKAVDIELEPGLFKKSGTSVGVMMLVIYKSIKYKEPVSEVEETLQPLVELEKNLLREYKGYKLFDIALTATEHRFDIETPDGSAGFSNFFNSQDPTSLNKVIERGKEWVDLKLNETLSEAPVIKDKSVKKTPKKSKLSIKKEAAINQTETQKEDTPVRKCRVCGCTEEDCSQCIKKTGKACHWVEQDLCSACVEEPEIKVIDTRASTSPETITQSSNNTDMNFFEQLATLGNVDFSMRIMKVNGSFTIGITPGNAVKGMKQINISGTPEEFDKEFFATIMPRVREVKGLVHNIDEVKKEVTEKPAKKADKTKWKKPANTPVAKKKETKKVVVKKTEKKTGVKKPAVAKEEKVSAVIETSLFDQPAEVVEESNFITYK